MQAVLAFLMVKYFSALFLTKVDFLLKTELLCQLLSWHKNVLNFLVSHIPFSQFLPTKRSAWPLLPSVLNPGSHLLAATQWMWSWSTAIGKQGRERMLCPVLTWDLGWHSSMKSCFTGALHSLWNSRVHLLSFSFCLLSPANMIAALSCRLDYWRLTNCSLFQSLFLYMSIGYVHCHICEGI